MFELLQKFQGLFALAVSLFIAVAGWAFRTQVQKMLEGRASVEQVSAIADQVRHVDQRVLAIEARLDTLPTADQITSISLSIEALRGDVKVANAQLVGTRDLLTSHMRKVELIDEYMKRSGS